ncbi:hypothetical protein [Desulfonatronum thiodismutans]|uniref:hypothetical protein n=1 Tax=Desulfonatronum thiodismutans TaxID=159290 RepID=UPI0004ABD67C|nr:hypothetical protein [Desulfonatronum thiodismutans]
MITKTIPEKVAEAPAFRNAQQNSDKENAPIEYDKALLRVMAALIKDDTDMFKLFMDNESFRSFLTSTVFRLTYEEEQAKAA